MFSRLKAKPLLRMYFVTSPSSSVIDLGIGDREGKVNLRFSPPVGFDMTATVIVFAEWVCVEEEVVVVVVRSDFGMVVLGLVEDVLDGAGAEVA